MSTYLANLKYIANNLLLLYRNFFHWNISKLIVFLYANIAGLLLSLPLAAIVVYQYFSSYSKLGISVSAQEFLLNNIGNIIVTIILFIAIVVIFIATYTYGNFLMQNIYRGYLEGKRLPYKKNLYFSLPYFRTYMGILGWISLYMLAPVAVILTLIISFGILIQMNPGAVGHTGGWVFLVILAILVGWFLSLVIRLVFSYYGLLYSEHKEKPKYYTDESFRITKGKFWKIIFLILPFLLGLGIIGTFAQIAEDGVTEARLYSVLRAEQQGTGKDDHVLLEGHFFGNNEEKKTQFGNIEKLFLPMTEDINREFLSRSLPYLDEKGIDPTLYIYESLFVLFSFLFLEGVASMIYFSVYHIIKVESGLKV